MSLLINVETGDGVTGKIEWNNVGENEADSRAKMLIYLIEQGIVKLERRGRCGF